MLFSLMPWLTLGGTLLMAVYVILCLQAEAPKEGTLEWISMYEKPKFSLLGEPYTLTGSDLLQALLAYCLKAGCILLMLLLGDLLLQNDPAWLSHLPRIIAMGFAAAALWLTAKHLTASSPAAWMAAILFAATPYYLSYSVPALLAVLPVLHRWLRRREEETGLGLLTLAALAFSIALLFEPSFLPLCIPVLLLIVLDGVWRCRHADAGVWTIPVGLLLFAGLTVLFTVAEFAVVVILGFNFVILLETLQTGLFFRAFLEAFWVPNSFSFLSPGTAANLFLLLPQVLLSLGSIVLLAVGFRKRKEPAAGFVLLWVVSFSLFSLCAANALFSLSASLGCAYFADRLIKRGRTAAAVAGTVFAAAASLILYVLLYL